MSSATQQTPTEIVQGFLIRYANDVEGFVREVLNFPNTEEKAKGWDIYEWQLEAMKAYERGERRITIRSGHGVGKTTFMAWIALFASIFRFPQRTAVTAPTEKQLFNAFWADFKVWHSRLPTLLRALVNVKGDRAEHSNAPGESYLTIATARKEQPEALQGIHSPGWVTLIVDEASGVPGEVFEAGTGSMSGHNCTTILAGNPVRGSGFFFDTHTRLADLWWTRRVSCYDVPKGVSADFIEQIRRTYGENSNAFRVRVLGEFPVKDDDTVIPFDLVEASFSRDVQVPKLAPVVWGVDPARFGNDRSTLAKRQTRQLLEPIKWWEKLDTMELCARIKAAYDTEVPWLKPQIINVDVIGIGAGVVDRLKELGLPVRGINVSEAPATIHADRYANLRTELWFKGLEWFASRDCKLPEYYQKPERSADGDDLVTELTTVKYKFRPGSGKIAVESKDEIKKRGMRSPDLADSFLLTLATDEGTLATGRFGKTAWNTPIRVNRKGIV